MVLSVDSSYLFAAVLLCSVSALFRCVEERRCALQLHCMMEEMFGVSLLLPALLRRLTGRGLFQEMVMSLSRMGFSLQGLWLQSVQEKLNRGSLSVVENAIYDLRAIEQRRDQKFCGEISAVRENCCMTTS